MYTSSLQRLINFEMYFVLGTVGLDTVNHRILCIKHSSIPPTTRVPIEFYYESICVNYASQIGKRVCKIWCSIKTLHKYRYYFGVKHVYYYLSI